MAARRVFGAVKRGHGLAEGLEAGLADGCGLLAGANGDEVVPADMAHKGLLRNALPDDGRKAFKYLVAIVEAVFVVVGFEVVYIEIKYAGGQPQAHHAFQLNIDEGVARQFGKRIELTALATSNSMLFSSSSLTVTTPR